MARKVNLSESLARMQADEPEEASAAPAAPQASPPATAPPQRPVEAAGPAEAPERAPERPQARKPAGEGRGARFDEFVRKEARFRPDQLAALTEHARALNRAKGPAGDRITENTLIRVAVDLLLAEPGRLHGRSEAELFDSVTTHD